MKRKQRVPNLGVAVIDDDLSGSLLEDDASDGALPPAGPDDPLGGEPARKPGLHVLIEAQTLEIIAGHGRTSIDGSGGREGGGGDNREGRVHAERRGGPGAPYPGEAQGSRPGGDIGGEGDGQEGTGGRRKGLSLSLSLGMKHGGQALRPGQVVDASRKLMDHTDHPFRPFWG